MSRSNYLETALFAAQESGKIIQKYYHNGFDVTLKEDLSPVTQADREAEDKIISIIRERFPEHAILGEETGKNHSNSEFQWVIDPLDGTKNFTHHIPFFATEIALRKNGEFIVGVSNAPLLNEGECLYAEKEVVHFIMANLSKCLKFRKLKTVISFTET
jgi:histidinol-phosphatase